MQILLDPFKELFHVPTFVVEFRYGQSFVAKMIGQETIDVAGGEVFIGDQPQLFRITLGGLIGSESDYLVRNYTGVLVNGIGLDNFISQIVFGTGDEESPVLVYAVEESEEIQVSHINQVDGPLLNAQLVQSLDIMHGSLCDIDEYRDVATQVKQRMHLDARLGSAELGPRTELQAEADCRAVESIYGIVKIQPEGGVVISVEGTHFINENLPKVSVDAPVPEFICLCQSVAWNHVADTVMVELMGHRRETRLNIPETVLAGKLSLAHDEELIVAGEVPDTIVPVVTGHAIVKLTSWNERHYLGKNGASGWHDGKITDDGRKCIKLYRVHPENRINS